MSERPRPAMPRIEIASASRSSALAPAPPGIGEGLAAAAARCLEHLPDGLLDAMVTGLRANADDLAPGALFRGRHSGGCAVGVMLRELAPDAFRFGRVEFWLWHRWRRGVELDVARRFPELHRLQRIFDDAVDEVRKAGLCERAAGVVGLWLATGAEAELRARRATAQQARPLAGRPARWSRRRAHRPLRGPSGTGASETDRAHAETSSCS